MYFKQKFEPKKGIIHGAGQSPEQFKKYWNAVGNYKPLIYMAYNRINNIQEKLLNKIKELLSIDKKLWLQLGLNLKPKGEKEKCKEILQGKYDEEINFLIKTLKNFKNPVFLRIGYEFNESNKYQPKEFILAWKYIVDLFRNNGITNVAFVWCSCTAFSKNIDEIMKFYPGDNYVDWFGNDLFGVQHFKDNADKVTEDFCREAEKHKKPLIIGESSPARIGVDKGEESWNMWFKPFFKWISDHSIIKAFCYINWDWGKDWKQPEWLNGRIEENEIVRKNYVKELSNKIYIHNKQL
ncbi:MAG: glycosyl hydrolase [archaeon]|nr:glycosyl hydrolase [archaeon]